MHANSGCVDDLGWRTFRATKPTGWPRARLCEAHRRRRHFVHDPRATSLGDGHFDDRPGALPPVLEDGAFLHENLVQAHQLRSKGARYRPQTSEVLVATPFGGWARAVPFSSFSPLFPGVRSTRGSTASLRYNQGCDIRVAGARPCFDVFRLSAGPHAVRSWGRKSATCCAT